jgi:hypothetical protein
MVKSIYMLYFFKSLIDFDLIEVHLILDRVWSGRVRIGSNQFDFFKKIRSIRVQIRTGRTDFSDQIEFCNL